MNKYYQIIRRRFYLIFRKKYILKSIQKRKGKCNHCSCCQVSIFGRKYHCRFFDAKTKLCLIYNTSQIPNGCYYYPFDEKDKWDEFKDKCGFYWVQEINDKNGGA